MESSDASRLIAAVRRRPALWDPAHPLYADKAGRARLWRQVCRELVPDYDRLDDSLKKPWVNVVISRWKNVRDAYRKAAAFRKVKGGVYGKCIYAEDMRFMDPILKLRTGPAGARGGPPRQNPAGSQPRPPPAPVEVGPLPTPAPASPGAAPARPGDAPARPHDNNSTRDHRNKQENVEQQILQMLFRAEEHERARREDEDALFFESLVPSVRRLPSAARLRLRADVSQLVHAYALQYELGPDHQTKTEGGNGGTTEKKKSEVTVCAPKTSAGPATTDLVQDPDLKPPLEHFQSYFTAEYEGVQYRGAATAAAAGPDATAIKEEPTP